MRTGDEHQPSCDEIAVLLDRKQERSDLKDLPLNSNIIITDGHFLSTYPVPQSTGQYKHDRTHALVKIETVINLTNSYHIMYTSTWVPA